MSRRRRILAAIYQDENEEPEGGNYYLVNDSDTYSFGNGNLRIYKESDD